jgi:tripartite-type tricarboxylate transporter receptor subunit TctC
LTGLAFLALTAPGSRPAAAAGEPIKLIVPVPPGGAADILARTLAAQLTAGGTSVIVESRPGAGTAIGTDAVARAAPDGHTLLLNAPYILINPQLRKLNYDPLTSFEPVCYLVSSPGLFVVNSASPYKTLHDFVEAARKSPQDVAIGSVGPGTAQQIGIEMLKQAAGVGMTYVPYPGGAPAINDLLGNHITAVFAEYAPLAGHLKAGTFRALATSAKSRIAQLPDVPTVAEAGYANYAVDFWWGLFAPAKTPRDKLERLSGQFTAALNEPDVRKKLASVGFSPVGLCGSGFSELLRKEYAAYGRVIRETNLKAE